MTVGELQQVLESIQDKNTTVVIFDQLYKGCWTVPTDVMIYDALYIGNHRWTLLDAPGEPEQVLIIQ